MQYALVDGMRTEPVGGQKGMCPACGKEVQAKCGDIRAHHWAHVNLKDCDSWAETETQWHIDWKNKFPEAFREVPFTDPITKEIHRADVHTNRGITLEFQNSPISIEELKSRDEFYDYLIWIVNGAKFKGGFELMGNIPNPVSPLLDNFSICGIGRYNMNVKENLMFFRKPLNDNDFEANRILDISDPLLKEVGVMMDNSQPIYWMFEWKHKHTAWFATKSPVFLDFGNDFLYWLKVKEQHRSPSLLWYVKEIKKVDFIKKYSH
jgi:competence protein CoiA